MARWQRAKTWLKALFGVFCGWLGTLALVMFFTDAAPGAIVVIPPENFASTLSGDIAVVGGGKFWIAVRSDAPDLGRVLYRAGALLVLPAGLPGCLPLPSP